MASLCGQSRPHYVCGTSGSASVFVTYVHAWTHWRWRRSSCWGDSTVRFVRALFVTMLAKGFAGRGIKHRGIGALPNSSRDLFNVRVCTIGRHLSKNILGLEQSTPLCCTPQYVQRWRQHHQLHITVVQALSE